MVHVSGKVGDDPVTIAIFEIPKSKFPYVLAARGYGLFAANPLGRSIFTNGKEPPLNSRSHLTRAQRSAIASSYF